MRSEDIQQLRAGPPGRWEPCWHCAAPDFEAGGPGRDLGRRRRRDDCLGDPPDPDRQACRRRHAVGFAGHVGGRQRHPRAPRRRAPADNGLDLRRRGALHVVEPGPDGSRPRTRRGDRGDHGRRRMGVAPVGQPGAAGGDEGSRCRGQGGKPGPSPPSPWASEDCFWAFRTPTLNGLSYRFAVRCHDVAVGLLRPVVARGSARAGRLRTRAGRALVLVDACQPMAPIEVVRDGESPGARTAAK